ncbi:FAD-dependent tricarballylate dehydrogenase TcuA [Actinoalloteichus hymeniacidonis]|uniref:Succinate dehydrogenase/fumarate reductase flavoprotein subunit n=1 Tax=Actinoalloteichus hymeniacidonis TaxID=340345 RepID=A0AAC9N0N7_9PSEU|nr:FAD-dependent tricarballylate dehydrogenase TcuA [Actinoalloteichus hymeniacidonis]AOS65282.1 succinate dehydrogenase/fumarate reductase flavoprotein subunit [Actinoalloteichus hymeniacidonis]MBB5906634.1 tricarballylate dehydrogenase [Actinoalloteichus hymeniacidonis]
MPQGSSAAAHDAAPTEEFDVIVVGGGNAGFSAAHAAAERGRRVVLLEKGLPDQAGGNSYYTAGAVRIAHHGLADVADLLEPDERHAISVLPPYSAEEFAADMATVTSGRNDPALTEVLCRDSLDTLRWLHGKGLRYRLMYERQAYSDPQGRQVFWGGLAVGSVGGGKGLIEQHTRAAEQAGIEIRYGIRVRELVSSHGAITGVTWTDAAGREGTTHAESVVLAAGGFQADPELRRKHLGAGWQAAKVRGTPLNTGDLLTAAIAVGAATHGDFATCHSVAWDAWFPENEGNREFTNQLTRGGYPLGIVVNKLGARFIDEGADFRNYTYAKYGADILAQPEGLAFQLFDATTRPRLRAEEYDMPGASVVTANTIEELAGLMGVDPAQLARTVADFNASIDRSVPLDLAVKDGRAARIEPPKSHWAIPLENAPYYAFPVTCGITFTFGGLHADVHGRVLDQDGVPLPGLLVCGEMLGGLFSGNYPGGSGLTAGAVFGRRAGTLA